MKTEGTAKLRRPVSGGVSETRGPNSFQCLAESSTELLFRPLAIDT